MIELKGFVSGAYQARSVNADAQRCINWYPEVIESGLGKSSAMLVPTPGMRYFAAPGAIGPGAGRAGGLYVASNGRCFSLSGNDFYEVNADQTTVARGNTVSFFGPVGMADNGEVLFIVDGTDYYVFNFSTNILTTYTDASLNGSTHVGYLGGFFVVNCPNDSEGVGIFRWSPLLWNGTDAWDPLAYAAEDGSPDNVIALVVSSDVLWLMGSKSMAAWYLSGGLDLPFSRSPGTSTQIGTAAKYSLAEIAGSAFWIGSSKEGQGQVFRTSGYSPVRISTHAIEDEISQYETLDDAIGFTYQDQGHLFYVLCFQTGNKTWVYDLTSNLWHERKFRDPVTAEEGRWRPVSCVRFGANLLVNSYADNAGFGTIYTLENDYYYDDGANASQNYTIVRRRTSPHVSAGLNRVRYNLFQVDMETGVGLTTGQGSDPLLMLTYSNDGGHSYGVQRTQSIGRIGEYKARVRFLRCGMSRDRVWSIAISDPVKAVILGAWMDLEVMAS